MKASMLILMLALLIGAGYAQANFTLLATGQFDGRSSTCVVGDTIYVVHNTATTNETVGQILLQYRSLSNPGNWTTKLISSTIKGLTRPTISTGNGFMLISYVSNFQRYLARSYNGWETWQIATLGKTFEAAPLIEPDGAYWVNYSLDIPYPEWEEHRFLTGENSDNLTMPQYFTDLEQTWYGGNIYFFGQDTLNGVMRSNSDIWIRQAGGGPNNGWPIFNDLVMTSGQIRDYSGGYPPEYVFVGGLMENVPTLAMPTLNTDQATIVGPTEYNPNYFVFVTVSGSTYHARLARITERVEQMPYYSVYPAANLGTPLGTNTYTTRDTLWVDLGTATCGTGHFHSPNQLWISGVFSGHQTWSSDGKIMIKNDILLSGTAPGTDPAVDAEDSVTLITTKDIEVKYGYTDPVTGERIHLARDDQNPIYIYANVIALGNSNDPRSGKFTFEYQRPHPSVPDLMFDGDLWNKIDLHRRPYPPTATSPWPSMVDYPWYNPLWPERHPLLERGILSIKGSIIQRRRGFIHRSYFDVEHFNNGIWDIGEEYFGGSSAPEAYGTDPVLGFVMAPMNFNGATGGGVGYKKRYSGDDRTRYSEEGTDNPGINRYLSWDLGIRTGRVVQSGNNQFTIEGSYRQQFIKRVYSKAYTQMGAYRLFAVNDALLLWQDGQYTDLSHLVAGYGNIRSIMAGYGHDVLVHCVSTLGTSVVNRILRIHLTAGAASEVNLSVADPYNLESSFSDIVHLPDGTHCFVRLYPYQMKLVMWEISPYNTLTNRRVYNCTNFGDTYGVYQHNKLVVNPRPDDSVDVFAWVHDPTYGATNLHAGRMYYARLSTFVANDEPLIPAVLPLALHAYPNPTRGAMTVRLDGIKQQAPQVSVYNIRGQKVIELNNFSRNEDGCLSTLWDGCDAQGKRLSGGVYLLRATVDGKHQLSKRVTLIW